MPTYEQLPGGLGLAFRRGDYVATTIDFDPTSFTGQSMTASIVSVVSGETVAPMTVAFANASAGQVNVSLSASDTASLAAGTYRWSLRSTDGTAVRTYLAGYVEVSG
jgi:hypothetical protein